MSKILITGSGGMLGSMLAKLAREKGHEVIPLERAQLDITDKSHIHKAITEFKPDVVVNCAAYTNVEQAEDDVELSKQINGKAPGLLAKECHTHKVIFIHISTDNVFGDNDPKGHVESDKLKDDQLNQYAKSKAEGEKNVLKNNPEAYIVRTSWVFGPNGKNFVDTILMLAETRNEFSVVIDDIGVPTYTKDISNQILYIIENQDKLKPGIYHAVSEGHTSRYELAKKVFELSGKNVKVNEMYAKDYPRKAAIPNFSILLNTKLPKLQNWEDAVKKYLESKKS
jgi:dTDP-4-dehydrorhamnose reductase